MPNLAIVASGTRGDVQPYVALGQGLQAAGYTVHLLTSDDFAPLAQESGLIFHSLGISVESLLQSPEWKQTIEGGNFLKILARMQQAMRQQGQQLSERLPAALAGMDGLVAGMSGLGGAFAVADQRRLPIIQAYLLPFTPTSQFASPIAPLKSLGAWGNQLSFHAMRQLLWHSVRAGDVATRRALGLPSGSFWGAYRQLAQRRLPVLYGYSSQVLPRPSDWPDYAHVTGFWFLEPTAAWQPPPTLTDFLAAGDPPVYIGFGSMGNRDAAATTQIVLEALAQSGQRGVLAAGWGGLQAEQLPPQVYMLPSAPHTWLFPRMAAVVQHGGVGTTAAGFRAGVPQVVVPFFGDQPYWGRRVAELGVGTAPLPRKQLTAARLAERIRQAVQTPALRERAAALGIQIRAEDGVARAVEHIQRYRA